jgi:transcriptional regulator with XRE-family HTH domain
VFATNLRRARETSGLTQDDAAWAAWMDQSQYNKLERGKVDPSIRTLARLAAAVESTPSELLAGVEVPPRRTGD